MARLAAVSEGGTITISEAARTRWDAVLVGGGHNGLVAAVLLARAGLKTLIVEGKEVLGGAVRTERPFARAPNLPASTGAYLLGLMPPELLRQLGLDLPLLRRDPHYFLPTTDTRYLLFGSDRAALEAQFRAHFAPADWTAHLALEAELAELREDVAPSWLQEPLSIEETAERYLRPLLRQVFVDLCRGSIATYLGRFGFKSELLQAMYAVTDAFSGLYGGWDSPGTGMNFLIHNMCRLPGADGTWMVVRGGMGTITQALADAAVRAGAKLLVGRPVERVLVEGGTARGVLVAGDAAIAAEAVIANCDPFTLETLVGSEHFPEDFNQRLHRYRLPGSTLKLNLALESMPRFRCLPQAPPGFGPTIHLLPEEPGVLARLAQAFEAAQAGRLPDFPSIEWYVHTPVDPSLTDEAGRLSSALFVQWVPYRLSESDWETEEERYADHLLSICDRFAPGTSSRVVDRMILHPQRIEARFGIKGGHIHHVDNSFGFSDRLPHALPLGGLYSCSAATHPAGSVIGAAGYLAAGRVLGDRGRVTGPHD